MCMKNINTDIIFFDEAELTSDENQMNLFSVIKETPIYKVKKNNQGDVLTIPQMNFLLSVNATEKIINGNVYHEEGETPNNTFFFDSKYKVCLRVTETKSSKFVDLETFYLNQQDVCKRIERKIYNKKYACQYSNVSVAMPPNNETNTCVLKVLVKKVAEEGESENKWFVQSIHPIVLDIDDCQC